MSKRIIQKQVRIVTALAKKLSDGLQVLESVKTDLESLLDEEQPVKKTVSKKTKDDVAPTKTSRTRIKKKEPVVEKAESTKSRIGKKPSAKKVEAEPEEKPRKKRRRRPVEA